MTTPPDVASDAIEMRLAMMVRTGKHNTEDCLTAIEVIQCMKEGLVAAESRLKELERENEWRGLLVKAGMRLGLYVDGGGYWRIAQDKSVQISPSPDDDWPERITIPLRPDDATVQRIKEAIGE